ncbi:SOS response-associated peptidase [Dyadobacter tibetensis]|uniref:SOS response-associated peptidase n=1 Tax=Dyadobacter tibetensis TaxID=1211851 RepID=UPI000470FF72|nr:SOS response-associated peptidase [Dyadobacter tibetensis]
MCYHISLENKKQVEAMQKPIRSHIPFVPKYHFNGFDKPMIPVLSILDPGTIELFRWRLVPEWVKKESEWKANTLNARNDELFEKSAYRDYWQNRCLVLCTGFFEPHTPGGTTQTHSWYIKPAHGGLFTLGGIFTRWKDLFTFSIITTDAGPHMAAIHNEGERMPLILEGEAAEAWLSPTLTQSRMKELMVPYTDESRLTTYRVMDGVFNARLDTNCAEVLKEHPTGSRLNEGGTLSLF